MFRSNKGPTKYKENKSEKEKIFKEQQKQEEYYRQNQTKAEELRQKEEELKRKSEDIKRRQKQAEEELRRFRQQQGNPRPEEKNQLPTTLKEAFVVLGTKPGLSLAEYKAIWRDQALKYHPDKTNTLGERLQKQAEEEMKIINRAWEIIKKIIKQ